MPEPQPSEPASDAVAIIGMAGRLPGAPDLRAFWRLLREGREATTWLDDDALRAAGVPAASWADPHYVRASLPLPGMECFDAAFFGLSPREAAVMDPQHRHFLECAWTALEDAGHVPARFDGAIGVYGGCGLQAYFARHLLPNEPLLQSMGLFLLRHTGNDKDFLTTRVSYLLDLQGPSLCIQAACATSLVAVHVASQALLAGECDLALAGGASIELPHRQGYAWAPGEILSPDGHCRAFDDAAGGTLFGSGVGLVVLRRLADALRDGDTIHAVVRGSAVNNDGRGKAGYLAPSVDGQARVAQEALAVARLRAADIDYVEAHGTGTPVGDPIEVAALSQAYGEAGPGALGLGSVKTNVGHLDTAAGIAGLFKVCLALRHALLPASLNFERPNRHFDLARMPFQVLAQARPWARGPRVRRAAVHALGVGGTNAHLVLEEAPAPPPAQPALPWQLFVLSARTEPALQALQERWVDFLGEEGEMPPLADAAFTLQEGRGAFEHRLAVVARDAVGLRESLRQAAASGAQASAQCARAGQQAPPVVFLLPGAGAQVPGAARDLLALLAFRHAVDECLAHLPADAPRALRERLFELPSEDRWLERPACALPALFILEYALTRLWQDCGVQPVAVLGHSAGEHAAACIAGMLSLPDALALVTLRALLFEQTPPGGMLSVDLDEASLLPHLEGLPLDIAALNAPDLCMVSGAPEALGDLQQRLARCGVESRRLHVAVAAHSRSVECIAPRLLECLQALTHRPARLPFLSSVTARWVQPGQAVDAGYWMRHLRQPVRFAQAMATLLADHPQAVLLEAGPGQGLGSLARSNGAAATHAVLASTARAGDPSARAQGDLPVLLASAGALWCRGMPLRWEGVRGPGARRRVSLPTYAFARERHWIEAPAFEAPASTAHAPGPEAASDPAPARVAAGDAAPSHREAPRRLARFDDWFSTEVWQRTPLPAPGSTPVSSHMSTQGQRWLLVGGPASFAGSLQAALARRGVEAMVVAPGPACESPGPHRGRSDPREAGDLGRVLEALEARCSLPATLVHLGALEAPAGADPLALAASAFLRPVALVQALQALDLPGPLDLLMVTAGSQALEGERVRAPQQALALGLVRVVPRECPWLRTRLVDLDPQGLDHTEAVASQLIAEAQACKDPAQGDKQAGPAAPDCVAWRRGQRWCARRVPLAAPSRPDSLRLRRGGHYLVTGGLGDLGLALAKWLAQEGAAGLALVGRRGLPPPSQWPEVAARADGSREARLCAELIALADAGTQVQVHAADVSDRGQMAQVVAACALRWGEIHGVFHLAGEMADAALGSQPPSEFQRVMAGKAGGALVLHQLLPPPLDVFAVFSSTSVDLGPPGQVGYVAANAVAEAVAAARPDGLAIRWGLWADTGMAARAWGASPPGDGPLHPLLGRVTQDAQGLQAQAWYDPAQRWVLSEHRVAGRPVLPGSAYLELARAAMQLLHPGRGLELRALSIDAAMVFDEAPRRLRVLLQREPAAPPEDRPSRECVASPGDEAWSLRVQSCSVQGDHWIDHAHATARVLQVNAKEGPAPLQALPGGATDPAHPEGGPDRSEGPANDPPLPAPGSVRAAQAGHPALDFGARWACVQRVQADAQAVTAHLALPEPLRSDLDIHPCHPALLDLAATAGLHALQGVGHGLLYAPRSIERVRLFADLPAQVESRAIRRAPSSGPDPVFDVTLRGPGGQVLARIEGLVLQGVAPQALAASRPRTAGEGGGLQALLAQGLRAAEAPALFERVLRLRASPVIVSSLELEALRERLAPAAPTSPLAEGASAEGACATGSGVGSGAAQASTAAPASDPPAAPLSALEERLAQAWRDLLGVKQVRREDDFFALGGHSLVAVRLFARLRKQLGVDLPLSTLFEASTLERLAAVVGERLPQADSPGEQPSPRPAHAPPGDTARMPWSPLVEIAAGDAGRPPLLCVHGAGGNVLNFRLIADRLGPGQAFYGLQAQGVDGRLPPLEDVPAMASQYVQAVREAFPQGPYRLAGYSAGGMIALEMAHLLREQGERVEWLAMIDTLAPAATRARVPLRRKLWLVRHWSPRFALGWFERRRRGRVLEARYQEALDRLARGEPLAPELVEHHLFKTFLQAQARYEPRPWPGAMVLLRAADGETQYMHAGHCLGWDRYILGGIRVVEITGSHFSMMREPGLSELAAAMCRELDCLDRESQASVPGS